MSGRSVLVTLDRERHLRFDLNALCDLETVLGHPVTDILGRGVGLSTLRAMVWAGLKHEDTSLSLTQAGTLMQGYLDAGCALDTLSAALNEALALAGFGETNGKADAAPLASVSGAGAPNPSPSATSG